MLVLARSEGEAIVIGTGDRMITVEVVRIGGGQVRLGVTAPADLEIDRQEVRKSKETFGRWRNH